MKLTNEDLRGILQMANHLDGPASDILYDVYSLFSKEDRENCADGQFDIYIHGGFFRKKTEEEKIFDATDNSGSGLMSYIFNPIYQDRW